MLVQVIVIRPALSRLNEAREALERHVRANPLDMAGGLVGPVFGQLGNLALYSRHEDMAALEKMRDAADAHPQIQALRKKIGSLTREPAEVLVYDFLVPSAASSSGPYRENWRVVPAMGKGPEARALLEEFARAEQAAGRLDFSCAAVRYASSGPSTVVRDTYASLAEMEEVDTQRRTSDSRWAFVTKVVPLLTSHVTSVRRLIVAYGG